jgi:hypothetical protein
MFFTAKSKGYFVEINENAVFLARTSTAEPPFVVEEIIDCAPGDLEILTGRVNELKQGKAASGYLSAVCGINPARRLVRRISLEPKRLKEPTYLNELIVQQLRIEPDQYAMAALSPTQGTDYDMLKCVEKDMLICGLPNADRISLQDGLLDAGIYPKVLEISSLATIGAIIDYLKFADIKNPVLVLELEAQTTNSYIVSAAGLESSRPIMQGLESMVPIVQKELGLKDEAAARKLFLSNAFDFTGMGSLLLKKIIKELQSSIGFYEVQTGQSIDQIACTILPSKLAWLESAIATDLGVSVFKPEVAPWLKSHAITLAENVVASTQDTLRFGLFALMVQTKTSNVVTIEKV